MSMSSYNPRPFEWFDYCRTTKSLPSEHCIHKISVECWFPGIFSSSCNHHRMSTLGKSCGTPGVNLAKCTGVIIILLKTSADKQGGVPH